MGILVDKTADCPYVNFSEEGMLEIEGRSITEDPFSFWQPLLEWVEEYLKKPAASTQLTIFLEYTNSSSNKYVNEILRKFEDSHARGAKIKVIWKYEEDDESILQLGEDLQGITGLPFEFVEVDIEKERAQKVKIKSKKTGNEAIITARYWDAIVRNGHGDEYLVLEEVV